MPDSDLGKIRKIYPNSTWDFADGSYNRTMPQTTATAKQDPRQGRDKMRRHVTYRYQLTYTINGHERQTRSYAPTLRLAKRELLEALPDAVVLRVEIWSVS